MQVKGLCIFFLTGILLCWFWVCKTPANSALKKRRIYTSILSEGPHIGSHCFWNKTECENGNDYVQYGNVSSRQTSWIVGDDNREGIKMFTNFACATFSSDKTLDDRIPSEMLKEKCLAKSG
jgi:hypothetical protein